MMHLRRRVLQAFAISSTGICNLVNEHGTARPESAVLSFATASEVKDFCGGKVNDC
jgi:hypothetical protein